PVRNGSLSIIKTSSDTETTDLNGNITRIPAPQQDPACTPKTVTGVTGQVPCDLQIPIVVRVTP
ncbi:MAG TPA: hypothetical protein VKZ53_17475, partial [Candidatus Angelobacter sp.]|nr:hypothetical protein [Candidatus Angelobacter sp.]